MMQLKLLLTHSLLQSGCGVQKRSAYHPPPQKKNNKLIWNRQLDLALEIGTIQLKGLVESITVQCA